MKPQGTHTTLDHVGITDAKCEIVMLRTPEGERLELARCFRRDHLPGSPDAMANVLGLRNVAFEVDDVHETVALAAEEGFGLVGGVGDYEGTHRMAYIRGPEGIIVSVFQQLG